MKPIADWSTNYPPSQYSGQVCVTQSYFSLSHLPPVLHRWIVSLQALGKTIRGQRTDLWRKQTHPAYIQYSLQVLLTLEELQIRWELHFVIPFLCLIQTNHPVYVLCMVYDWKKTKQCSTKQILLKRTWYNYIYIFICMGTDANSCGLSCMALVTHL